LDERVTGRKGEWGGGRRLLNQRRERERVWHHGERRRGVGTGAPCRGGRRKERVPWHDGGRPTTALDRRARVTPCHANRGARGGGLIGGPWPQCQTVAPTDRRA
jgi:hypothetical protein